MMAMDNYFLFPPWDCDWDPHTFGSAGDLHQQLMPLATGSPASSSQASTGYLQDAVAGWSSRSKRRRLASSPSHVHCPAPLTTGDLQDILQGFLNSSYFGDPLLDQSRRPIEPGSTSPCGKSLRCFKELQPKAIQDPNSNAKVLTLKGTRLFMESLGVSCLPVPTSHQKTRLRFCLFLFWYMNFVYLAMCFGFVSGVLFCCVV
ncbi:uncharacterized protein LOC121987706 isoform X2 [Zingiber officinale]|uniref:uncharacterized protein LOC121987706 isoform X2 n=1 Tax=Zingiber officinale TaxID=94328 RepID=UPI001C4D9564|nr:uncharacterized protein LOC121987706 isoform X2 [Zingiber officinale]